MSDIFRDYTFGEFFKAFRKKNNIGLRQASEMLEMDSGNLSKLEQSRMLPPLTAKKIEEMGNKLLFNPDQIKWLCERAWSERLTAYRERFWGNATTQKDGYDKP